MIDAAPFLVALAFGSGLIPSVALANKQALGNLAGPAAAPKSGLADSPPLRSSPLLLFPEPIRLADVVAVACRLPARGGEKRIAMLEPARQQIRREDFSDTLPQLPVVKWPVDTAGVPVGGDGIARRLGSTLRSRRLSPVAIEAVWVALAGGSQFVARQEVARKLRRWRPEPDTFDLAEFETSLLQGRANILLGYVTLFGLQALVLSILVLKPLLEAVQEL